MRVYIVIMADKEEGDASHNFLRQFRDKNSRQFNKFTATQFMDVWNHYDSDGKCKHVSIRIGSLYLIQFISPFIMFKLYVYNSFLYVQ